MLLIDSSTFLVRLFSSASVVMPRGTLSLPELASQPTTVSVDKVFFALRPELVGQFRKRLKFGVRHGKRGFRISLRTVKAVFDQYFSSQIDNLESLDSILGADWRQKSKPVHSAADCPLPGQCSHTEYVRIIPPLRISWNERSSRITFCFRIEEVHADGSARQCTFSQTCFFISMFPVFTFFFHDVL